MGRGQGCCHRDYGGDNLGAGGQLAGKRGPDLEGQVLHEEYGYPNNNKQITANHPRRSGEF